MSLGHPKYSINDRVEFDLMQNGRLVSILRGTIIGVDAQGTYESKYLEPSYDVNVDEIGWFKHVSESRIRPEWGD